MKNNTNQCNQIKKRHKFSWNLILKVFSFLVIGLIYQNVYSQQSTIWKIGEKDRSAAEFALGPSNYSEIGRAHV